MQIIPTILQSDLAELKRQVALARSMPGLETIQIDVMDGLFTDEVSVGLADLTEVEYGDLSLDIHLMAQEPMDFVWELIELKEWLPIVSVTAQIERMSYQADFISEVRKQLWKAQLSLELYTPFESLDAASWAADGIQLLAVPPGSQGQMLNPMIFERLKELQLEQQRNRPADLDQPLAVWVDGGVKPIHLEQLRQAGATGVTVGSHIWQAGDPISTYKDLTSQLG